METQPLHEQHTHEQHAHDNHVVNITNLIKKRFDILVTTADTTYSSIFELDKTIKFVKGVIITADKDDQLYYRGSQKIEVNRFELFPEGYESKLLMSGINCSPNDRYYETGDVPIGNAQVKMEYKDTSDSRTQFVAYRVSIYLDCELIK